MIPFSDRTERVRRSLPVVMLTLIGANILIYLFEVSLGARLDRFILAYGVVPYEISTGRDLAPQAPGLVYATLITSMFLHGSPLHIASNMLYLWVFGDNVEDALGHFGFTLFYLAAGILAGLSQVLIDPLSRTPGIGASGAIAGVLAAYLVLFPNASVRTLVFLGPFITVTRISAVILILVWIFFQFFSGLASLAAVESTGIAYWAHIGGFFAGLVIILLVRPRPRRTRRL